tara:strand:- start:3024 stop:3134 length:111 start_codon:yes stop_codon:yes gene_type:complete
MTDQVEWQHNGVVVNLHIPVVEDPAGLRWIDPLHAA